MALVSWLEDRLEAIHSQVTVWDVLARYGVNLKNTDKAQQIQCPFHGKDNKPSCRVHPATPEKPSHVWCFVCHEQWDAISLFAKFEGFQIGKEPGKTPFTRVLFLLEKSFGLAHPEVTGLEKPENPAITRAREAKASYEKTREATERRLRGSRVSFDPPAFFRAGDLLDKVEYDVAHGLLAPDTAKEVLGKILGKIAEKERRALCDATYPREGGHPALGPGPRVGTPLGYAKGYPLG